MRDVANLCKSIASTSLFVQVVVQQPFTDVLCHFD